MGSRAKGSGQPQQAQQQQSSVLPTVMSVAKTIGGDSLAGGQQVNAPPPLAPVPATRQTLAQTINPRTGWNWNAYAGGQQNAAPFQPPPALNTGRARY